MVKKIPILLSLACCGMLSLNAYNAVKMTDQDNQTTFFLLNTNPKASVSGTTLNIETDNNQVSVEVGSGVRFEFVEYDPTSVDEIAGESVVFLISQEKVEGRNLKPNSALEIYDLSGKKLKSATADASGYVSMGVSELSAGIYLINSIDKKFKFYKK